MRTWDPNFARCGHIGPYDVSQGDLHEPRLADVRVQLPWSLGPRNIGWPTLSLNGSTALLSHCIVMN